MCTMYKQKKSNPKNSIEILTKSEQIVTKILINLGQILAFIVSIR